MAAKIYSLYFMIYLFISSSSIFAFEGSIYSLKTPSHTTGRKVCLVIIDGLRYDSVPYMPFLNTITKTKEGILYKSVCSMPSYSRPGYERILTGTESYINGIESNHKYILSLTPGLFYLCKKSNLTTSASGFYWLYELYPLQIDYGYYYFLNDSLTFKKSLDFIKHYKPDFIVIHPMTVDSAGHKYGGKSSEYINAAKMVDKNIENIWKVIANKGYTFIVTSDHGHKDSGGHGDGCTECIETPLALIGKDIYNLKPENNIKSRKQTDIAPTICDIMGLSKTIYMTGESIIEHNDDMNILRKKFETNKEIDFKNFFNITSIITYLILSSYTVINFACWFIIIELIKI